MKRWSDDQIRLLTLILDELIPENGNTGVPAAGTADVIDFLSTATDHALDPVASITRVLSAVENMTKAFSALGPNERVDLLRQVEVDEAPDFATLVRLTYLAYYSRPTVRPFLGVGAHPVHPEGYSVPLEDEATLQRLTAPVRSRGQVFRT